MNLDQLYRRYAEYSRRKWFPDRFPDPLGPFVDAIDDQTLKQLQNAAGKAPAALSLVILDLLPRLMHRDLTADVESAYLRKLDGDVSPATAFYYLRASNAEKRANLWNEWKEWAEQVQTPLYDWLNVRLAARHKYADVRNRALSEFGIDVAKECNSIEHSLLATRDLFDFELRRRGKGRTLVDWLAIFRFPQFDSLTDWNDFSALANNWALTCHVPMLPDLKRVEEAPHIQQVFPVDPPAQVMQRYGLAAGPLDVLRFVQELGRGVFYSGMNPELPVTGRFLGDPQIPHFWAYLYANPFTDAIGIARLIRREVVEVAPWLRLAMQFWIRYDCVLALYHERLQSDMKEAQDLYVACWETAFSIEPPHFLHLYDLERSGDALFRTLAYKAALSAEDRLKSLYGNEWFPSTRCAQRLRGYRHEGFEINLKDVLLDLNATGTDQFLLP